MFLQPDIALHCVPRQALFMALSVLANYRYSCYSWNWTTCNTSWVWTKMFRAKYSKV